MVQDKYAFKNVYKFSKQNKHIIAIVQIQITKSHFLDIVKIKNYKLLPM